MIKALLIIQYYVMCYATAAYIYYICHDYRYPRRIKITHGGIYAGVDEQADVKWHFDPGKPYGYGAVRHKGVTLAIICHVGKQPFKTEWTTQYQEHQKKHKVKEKTWGQ